MDSTYSTSSLTGLVSSKRRLHWPVLAGDAEVEADGLRVADVQVAVGLGREAGDDLGVAFLRDVARDDVTDEVTGGGRGCGGLGGHSGQRRRNDTADATPQFASTLAPTK
jgi:hypothetical protein